jgi:hypothetical protein
VGKPAFVLPKVALDCGNQVLRAGDIRLGGRNRVERPAGTDHFGAPSKTRRKAKRVLPAPFRAGEIRHFPVEMPRFPTLCPKS